MCVTFLVFFRTNARSRSWLAERRKAEKRAVIDSNLRNSQSSVCDHTYPHLPLRLVVTRVTSTSFPFIIPAILTMKLSLTVLSLISLVSVTVADECCLCDNCGALEPTRESAYVFNDRIDMVNTCEELAWNLLEKSSADSAECLESQSLFRSTCCTAAPLPEITRTEEQSTSRQLWGSSSWSVKPSTSSSYSSWGNNNAKPAVSFNRSPAVISTPTFSNSASGGSCSFCSSMSNGSLGIVVNGPGFQFTGAFAPSSPMLCR